MDFHLGASIGVRDAFIGRLSALESTPGGGDGHGSREL